jgi:hypothetical protein
MESIKKKFKILKASHKNKAFFIKTKKACGNRLGVGGGRRCEMLISLGILCERCLLISEVYHTYLCSM